MCFCDPNIRTPYCSSYKCRTEEERLRLKSKNSTSIFLDCGHSDNFYSQDIDGCLICKEMKKEVNTGIKLFLQRKEQFENELLNAITIIVEKFKKDTGISPHRIDVSTICITEIGSPFDDYIVDKVNTSCNLEG